MKFQYISPFLIANALYSLSIGTVSAQGSGGSIRPWQTEFLRLTNEVRKQNGLKELCLNDKLNMAAMDHAQYIEQKKELTHTGPANKETVGKRVKNFGFNFKVVGENLASAGTPKDALQRLMNSPPHRANILNGAYTFMGAGGLEKGPNVVSSWTQVFGAADGEKCGNNGGSPASSSPSNSTAAPNQQPQSPKQQQQTQPLQQAQQKAPPQQPESTSAKDSLNSPAKPPSTDPDFSSALPVNNDNNEKSSPGAPPQKSPQKPRSPVEQPDPVVKPGETVIINDVTEDIKVPTPKDGTPLSNLVSMVRARQEARARNVKTAMHNIKKTIKNFEELQGSSQDGKITVDSEMIGAAIDLMNQAEKALANKE